MEVCICCLFLLVVQAHSTGSSAFLSVNNIPPNVTSQQADIVTCTPVSFSPPSCFAQLPISLPNAKPRKVDAAEVQEACHAHKQQAETAQDCDIVGKHCFMGMSINYSPTLQCCVGTAVSPNGA